MDRTGLRPDGTLRLSQGTQISRLHERNQLQGGDPAGSDISRSSRKPLCQAGRAGLRDQLRQGSEPIPASALYSPAASLVSTAASRCS